LQHLHTMADEKAKFEAHMDARREEVEAEAKVKFADLVARDADIAKREKELDGLIKGYSDKVGELDSKLALVRKAAR
jgi:hypothetical protein